MPELYLDYLLILDTFLENQNLESLQLITDWNTCAYSAIHVNYPDRSTQPGVLFTKITQLLEEAVVGTSFLHQEMVPSIRWLARELA
jgi:hypothetical protein